MEVNIPLLDTITQIHRYTKLLKDLCVKKKKIKDNETVKACKNIYVILKKGLPQKYKDHGFFSIPCKLGSLNFSKSILDLGASINVFPLYVFEKTNLGPLNKIGLSFS